MLRKQLPRKVNYFHPWNTKFKSSCDMDKQRKEICHSFFIQIKRFHCDTKYRCNNFVGLSYLLISFLVEQNIYLNNSSVCGWYLVEKSTGSWTGLPARDDWAHLNLSNDTFCYFIRLSLFVFSNDIHECNWAKKCCNWSNDSLPIKVYGTFSGPSQNIVTMKFLNLKELIKESSFPNWI